MSVIPPAVAPRFFLPVGFIFHVKPVRGEVGIDCAGQRIDMLIASPLSMYRFFSAFQARSGSLLAGLLRGAWRPVAPGFADPPPPCAAL
jgi:hypothetical protein